MPPPNAHVGISCDANRLETPQRIMQILNLIQAKTQFLCYFWIRNSSHFAAHLVVFFLLLMERSSSKKPKALSWVNRVMQKINSERVAEHKTAVTTQMNTAAKQQVSPAVVGDTALQRLAIVMMSLSSLATSDE